MSARLSFDHGQVDSLPAILHAVHLALTAAEDNATSNGYVVDWNADWTLTGKRAGDQVVITCDPRYVDDPDALHVRQYAISSDGQDPKETEFGSEAFDTLDEARANCGPAPRERVMTRGVTAWTQAQS